MTTRQRARFDRRRLLKGALAAAFASAATPPAVSPLFAATARTDPQRVARLVERSLVVDMLAVLKLEFRADAYAGRFTPEQVAEFRASGIDVFHHAEGLGGPTAFEDALTFLAGWQGFVARNAEFLTLVQRSSDLDDAKAAGRIAVIMGIQNAEHFRTPDDVRFFYQLGQRCSQLTYNTQNRIGSGSTERVDGGITDFGVEIIKAMNETGMLIDVSHCGDRTTRDAIELSAEPIAITHSNCRALTDHPRNKTDAAIRALAKRGGVMGITGVRMFVRDREPTTVEHIVDHIDHVAELAGIEHVGIGSDADLHGYDDMPPDQYEKLKAGYKDSYAFREKIDTDGYDHPRKVYDLTEALLRRGYSDADIEAVLGGNFRRLLEVAWREQAGDGDHGTTEGDRNESPD
jgi:membrane dipeptidase